MDDLAQAWLVLALATAEYCMQVRVGCVSISQRGPERPQGAGRVLLKFWPLYGEGRRRLRRVDGRPESHRGRRVGVVDGG